MNPYLTSQDEAKLIKPVIIKYNHTGVKCAIRRVRSVKGKHNVRHMVHLVGKGLIRLTRWSPGCDSIVNRLSQHCHNLVTTLLTD